jgi:peptidoglycan/LPS O-acetylase OafA/YrhL
MIPRAQAGRGELQPSEDSLPVGYQEKNRVLGLDVLRFVAVTLVVFRHLERLKVSPASGKVSLFVERLSHALACGGWVGVDIFFVLSGFLVSGLLFREWNQRRDVALGRFLLRRGFKIYPAFWAFLVVMAGVIHFHHQPLPLRDFLGELFFLQNYWANLFNHTWSLAVEEHFYLFWAVCVWLLLRAPRQDGQNPFRFIPHLFVLTAIVCLTFRSVDNMLFPPSRVRLVFFCSHLRLDSLFFGVLLSYFWHFHYTRRYDRWLRRYRFFLAGLGIALLVPMFFQNPFGPGATWIRVDGFILCYLAGGALLFGFLKIFEGVNSASARFLGLLGRNSYSTYLWHEAAIGFCPAFFVQRTHLASSWLGYCLLANMLAWTIGIVAARLVEFPALKLRDHLFPGLARGRLRD